MSQTTFPMMMLERTRSLQHMARDLQVLSEAPLAQAPGAAIRMQELVEREPRGRISRGVGILLLRARMGVLILLSRG
jgi:hypothetical protein